MKMKRLIYATIILIIGPLSGCAIFQQPLYVTGNQIEPPQYFLGETPNVAVVELEGGRRDLQDAVVEAMIRHSRSGGMFIVENRTHEGIRFDIRDGRMSMTGKEIGVSHQDVFVKISVLDAYAEEERMIEERRTRRGQPPEIVPVIENSMLLAFTVGTRDRILMDRREFVGKQRWDLAGAPDDRRVRYERAAEASVEQFLRAITPAYVPFRIQLDRSDKDQVPILQSAVRGQVAEARELMFRYVEQHPLSAAARYNLAVMTDATGLYEEALEHYDHAMRLGAKPFYTDARTDCMRRLAARQEIQRDEQPPITVADDNPHQEEPPPDTNRNLALLDLREAQSLLNDLGLDCGTADGVMGPRTRGCIRSFQAAHGLQVSGEIDQATSDRLRQVSQGEI